MFVIGANSASTGYNLTRSLRTRASATPWLNRTFSAGNQKTWTLSTWVKRGTLGSAQVLLSTGVLNTSDSTFANFGFNASDQLTFTAYTVVWRTTTQVFRDPSSWYHIVLAFDTTQATAANRVKLYVNGAQVTAFASSTDPTLNTDYAFNQAAAHYLGYPAYSFSYFDGYKAETYFINGQQLTPTSFGSTNALTGVWQPAAYTGSYGTNGFYLPFTDNSALTTASNVGLGKDFSGNGNYWTTNNISITAGVTYDSMTDVPTLTSATAANFAVLNPLNKATPVSITNGNLQMTATTAAWQGVWGSLGVSSAKWYFEATVTANNFVSNGISIGVALDTAPNNAAPGSAANAWLYNNSNSGGTAGRKLNGATATNYGATYTTNDVIGVAVDLGAGTLEFYKNNTSQGVAFSSGVSGTIFPYISTYGTDAVALNCGQRPFSYTPPSGFVALNTYNLPTSTIVKGNTVMDATLYTGNNATGRLITNAASFKPDLVWIKARSFAYNNNLYDSVRGAPLELASNLTAAEASGDLTAFNTTGFTVNETAGFHINETGITYVGWQWQAGQGTTSSNANGTITSTVSVNASAGFSVVTYTGTNTGTPSPMPTVGHGLGVAPSLVIGKSRNLAGVDGGAWFVWTSAQATDNYLRLNTTAASASISGGGGGTMVAPTSSVFSTPYLSGSNVLANNYVAYCWTPIAGFSAFGSLTGNGSTDGVFVYTGFQPKFVMLKSTSTGGWVMMDTARNPYNVEQNYLYANSSAAEVGGSPVIDALSNGFKIRTTWTDINPSGTSVIYAAFSSNPFKNSLAV